jgi:phosphoribosyl-AMP cyclohydrolase
VDCDQDALLIVAESAGPACHTGARSCFYRRVEGETLVSG